MPPFWKIFLLNDFSSSSNLYKAIEIPSKISLDSSSSSSEDTEISSEIVSKFDCFVVGFYQKKWIRKSIFKVTIEIGDWCFL